MANSLGILFTLTTYGMWLRGDARGWVENGIVYPGDPILEEHDRALLKHTPFRFASDQWHTIGAMIGESLRDRMQVSLLALTVQEWHMHFVTPAIEQDVAKVVKCAKDAVRYGLRPGRPIWTDGYDKRFCFDRLSLHNRIAYVERHNLERGRAARPWEFLVKDV